MKSSISKINVLTRAIQANHVKSTSTFTPKGALCVVTDVGTRIVGAFIDICKCKIKYEKEITCSYCV